uniref:tetracycline destructase Tet(48) n=1 Tax=uncultured bacterium TaxID=77133 RepID=UPI00065F4867|nr:tetracycline destructase Tet(48) [uncultured bacterium]AKQ05892.1 tetracycline destructase Tet(48) [uncultured bacterium]
MTFLFKEFKGVFKMKKVLVVGAGVAGLAVCYWLKEFGFSPTLIEKSNALRKGGYGVDIFGIAVDIAKKMSVYEKICAMRTQLEHGFYVNADGHTLVEEQGEKFGFRQGEEVEILREDLIEILKQAIKDIPCHFNQRIKRIKQDGKHVEVTFKDNKTENYDLVIGADGVHSTTRAFTFDKEEYDLIDFGCYSAIFSLPNYLKLRQSEIAFDANQKFISVSSDKNPTIALASLMFHSNRGDNIRNEKDQKSFFKDAFIDLGWETNNLLQYMEESNDFYFDVATQIKMKSWTKGRIALVGDSGYCSTALSGQGTTTALVGAYILAGELKAANGNHITAFERYNMLLHPFVEANQELGAWINETFLLEDAVSKEAVEARTDNIIKKISAISNVIKLPEYSAYK